ncbi:MAG TPA: aminotransferase class V-fold PLP-dependent enzyme [Blastocatellia bacterium]|nr:aminotransferase class V-fold PLP-dependent enzyme [Blastocatellia bacterium]
MANDIDQMAELHALLDPLMDSGVLSREECDELCERLNEFLNAVRAPHIPNGESYWQHFQGLFDFKQHPQGKTPMNAANLCPEPKGLLELANLLRLLYNRNVAQQTRMGEGERAQQIRAARSGLARALGLPPPAPNRTDLAIVRNASEGNNAISCGYRHWSTAERENVVLWKENHPTNLDTWQLRATWRRPANDPLFDIRVVDFDSTMSDDIILERFLQRIDSRTRFVSFSETANSTGFRIPEFVIRRIWNHVQNLNNCHVHIDGTMAWGARAIDLLNLGCHSFTSSAHKWFLGPKETGILYMHPDKVGNFTPSIFAYDYAINLRQWNNLPNDALRFELLGQRDDVNIITLAWTQMMWDALEGRNPYQRVSDLAQHLKTELRRHDWDLITPVDQNRSLGVVRVIAEPDDQDMSLYEWMYDVKNIAGSGGKTPDNKETFRLCPHIYNTLEDVNNAINGMNEWSESGK